MKSVIIVDLCDAHVPFEDEKVVKAAIEFCEWIQPTIIITHEWMDFYELSRFVKNPLMATGYTLHEAREKVWYWYRKIKRACPDSYRVELNANHPKRLQKYLHSNASELCGLPEFEMDTFMKYSKMGIKLMNYYNFRDYLFKHGDIVRKYSGYTARGELEKEGMSGASGHSHRLGQHYSTKRGGKYAWMECGCLCRMDMEYLEDKVADWQHGLGLVVFNGETKHFTSLPLAIIDNEVPLLRLFQNIKEEGKDDRDRSRKGNRVKERGKAGM